MRHDLPGGRRWSLLPVVVAALLTACAAPPASEDAASSESSAATDTVSVADRAAARAEAEARAEAAARAREEARRMEAERVAAAEAAQREADRRAAEEAERSAAQRRAAERRAAAEAERLAAEQQAAEEAAAREAREAQRLAEQRQAEEEAKAEAQRRAREEAEQRATAEAERLAAEQRAAEAAAAREAEQAAAARPAGGAAVAAGSLVEPEPIPSADRDYSQDRPTQAEIAQLGNELTPMGSVRAGNADGTIPAWTGGITRPPAGYSPGDHHPDPFPNDEVVFSITAQNYEQFLDKLSPGQIRMFERYPDSFRMDVYPTRRSASFPERVYEMTRQNARTGRLTPNGEGVVDVAEGFPFPIPKNAYHLIWNHKLKYKGVGGVRYNNQVAPTASGAYTLIRLREEILGLYYKEGNTLEDIDNILFYFYQLVEGPARLAGNVLLVHESLNQVEQLRQAWIYNPGQRRVRRAPNVAYDNPGTASDGLRTNDMTDMFNGAMDRFTWRLMGKKEMYVPYNSYAVHQPDVDLDDLVGPGHLDPDYMRYELHRTWIVEANLKEGFRHINPKRVFYLDEDSYQILLTDHYDARGDLWRVSEAHSINYYDVPTFWSTIEVHHDTQSGRYIATGLDNYDDVNRFDFEVQPVDFTPQSLRKRGRR